MQQHEGNVPHMYLDSEGYVTIGIGSLVSSVSVAQKLPFVHDKTHKKTTASEIKTEFRNVLKQKKLSPIKYKALFYKRFTHLILTQNMIDNLLMSQLANFYKELKRLYAKFDTYPLEVKLALFDLIFNLGMTKLRKKFPKFNRAILAGDWKKAANESHRKRLISTLRNNYVKNLLLIAAKNQSTHINTKQNQIIQSTP